MAALQQIYHHVCIRIDDIKEQNEYIINAPLTLDEMVEFIKTRLNYYIKNIKLLSMTILVILQVVVMLFL